MQHLTPPPLLPVRPNCPRWCRTATAPWQLHGKAVAYGASHPPCELPPMHQGVSSPQNLCSCRCQESLPPPQAIMPAFGKLPIPPAITLECSMSPTSLPCVPLPGAVVVVVRRPLSVSSQPPPIIVCCWLGYTLVVSWLYFPNAYLSTYRALVQNGSSDFSTKKVEFPTPLFKSEQILYHATQFWLEYVPNTPWEQRNGH
jgi:hypothetical protein